jgi:hypothetical protein
LDRPAVLPESERRVLKGLVGVDAAGVRIYQGRHAQETTQAFHADAMAAGDAILIGATHAQRSPERLGLIAHELTHVARFRRSRFIPPIARGPTSPGAPVPTPPADEEELATRVERRVRRIAEAKPPARTGNEPPIPALPAAGRSATPHPDVDLPKDRSAPDDRPWGRLPAPWEPLPAWMSAPRAHEPTSHEPPISVSRPVPPEPRAATVPVRAAATHRRNAGEDAAQPALAQRDSPPLRSPEPDLDEQARRVYAILKRRLAAERRRTF